MSDNIFTPVRAILKITDELLKSTLLSKDTASELDKIRNSCDVLLNFLSDIPGETPFSVSSEGGINMDKMVFIVDDNDSNLTMAASILENDYKVLTMPSAVKMFSLLEKKKPDMILLDIEMPDVSGIEAIFKLKENPAWEDIPVIFLTGHEEENILSKAKETGVLDIVQKPIVPQILRDCVNKYIGNR